MDFIKDLFQNNPILAIILSLIVISAVVSIVRGLIKLALTLAIIAIIAVVFFDANPVKIIKTGQEVTQEATDYYKETLKPILEKEIKNAKYIEKQDGSYVVKTTSLRIAGKKGEDVVVVSYKNVSTKVDISLLGEKFKEFIESNSKGN